MAKLITGKVISVVADKTIVIMTTVRRTHPLYKKQYSVNRKFTAHDEKNECQLGDKVSIAETRPISKTKHFKLVEVIERPVISQKDQVDELHKPEEVTVPETAKRPVTKKKAEKTEASETKE